MRYVYLLSVALMTTSCSLFTRLVETELKTDYYKAKLGSEEQEKVYVDVRGDSITVVKLAGGTSVVLQANQKLIKRSLDLDVLAVPFKFRPSSLGFPRQLTTEFNGNIFFGCRIDRFKLHHFATPLGTLKKFRHRAFTVGTFGGIGSASITPWTTNYQTTDEYSGLVLSRGLSAMVGVNSLTVGVGVGWDYLTDRDKSIWIYQNKPWYGLTLSLNLN